METARREVLDHLLVFGQRHLERVLTEFIHHYHQARPHQSLGQRAPCPSDGVLALPDGEVMRQERLGGLIREYNRTA